jgi:hypothetical protein
MDDVSTKFEAKLEKKRKRELIPYKQDMAVKARTFTTTLEPAHAL